MPKKFSLSVNLRYSVDLIKFLSIKVSEGIENGICSNDFHRYVREEKHLVCQGNSSSIEE